MLNFTHVAWSIYMVVDATCLLHHLGYVHLDFKSSNLMMRLFSTSSAEQPYLLLPQIIDVSMADRQGSMVGATTGTKGSRIMDCSPRNPAGEVEVHPEGDSPGLAHVMLDFITAAAGPSSGPPTAHVLLQQPSVQGVLQRPVLQQVSAHTLLGNLQLLADCIPPNRQPEDEGQTGVLCTLLMWIQGFLHHSPAPLPAQQRPDEDALSSTSSLQLPPKMTALPKAPAQKPAVQHFYQQLSALNNQLAQQLPALQGPLPAMYAAMHHAMGSCDWLDVAAGRSELPAVCFLHALLFCCPMQFCCRWPDYVVYFVTLSHARCQTAHPAACVPQRQPCIMLQCCLLYCLCWNCNKPW